MSELWRAIGEMRWQHVVLIVAAMAAFVALSFAPAATCSIRITDTPTSEER